VDRRRIETDALKSLGTFQVPIRLATSVSATVEVTVAAKG
jgi:large subunit ribosomal protein L9